MIAVSSSRAFFRIPRVWQVTKSSVILSFKGHLQGYRRFHDLICISSQYVPKGVCFPMDWNKKRKAPVWRQISTQSGSKEECLMEDTVGEPENVANNQQVQVENEVGEAEAMKVGPTYQNVGLNDGNDVLGNSTTTSVRRVGDAKRKSVVPNKKYTVPVQVGASLMRFIKGKDGSTQRGIEEMGVKIRYPSSKKEDLIIIEGDSMDVITKASQKIQAVIDEAVKSPSFGYSHFVSLPLAIHPELVNKVTRFQSTILGDDGPKDIDETGYENSSEDAQKNDDKIHQHEKAPDVAVELKIEDDRSHVKVDLTKIPLVSYAPKATKSPTASDLGIDKSIFLRPERLHLTVLMLKLWNIERVHAAAEVLQSISSQIIEVLDDRPLFIRLKGLDCMRGSRAKCQVLYAPVEEIGNEGRLSRLCQLIIDAYVKAGLVLQKDALHKLKLHATVMNTTQRKGRRNKRRDDSFDARGIFEQFGSELWGDYHIREAHLSQRFVYDDNGFYHCCGSITFPTDSQVPESSAAQDEVVEVAIGDGA